MRHDQIDISLEVDKTSLNNLMAVLGHHQMIEQLMIKDHYLKEAFMKG